MPVNLELDSSELECFVLVYASPIMRNFMQINYVFRTLIRISNNQLSRLAGIYCIIFHASWFYRVISKFIEIIGVCNTFLMIFSSFTKQMLTAVRFQINLQPYSLL